MARILCYTENYLPGGGNRYLVDAINSLSEKHTVLLYSNRKALFAQDFKRLTREHTYQEIDIWSLETVRKAIGYDQAQGVIKFLMRAALKSISLILAGIFSCHNRKLLRKTLKEVTPDLVFCFNGGYPAGYSCLDLMLEAKKAGIRRYLSVVSMPTAKTLIEAIFSPNINRAIDLVIVNSLKIKNDLVRTRHFPAEHIKVIYNSVLENRAAEANKFLQSISINKNSTLVGYTGRLETQKGVFYLVKAFSEIARQRKDVKLVMVGMGNDAQQLKDYIHDLSMQDQIILAGYYAGDIGDVLSAVDVYVFPSLWEGFPYSVIEAMAAGKIIIATDVGGIPEALEDGQDGFLVPPADANALRDRMEQVLSNVGKYQDLGRKAKDKVNRLFSPKLFALNINQIVSVPNN